MNQERPDRTYCLLKRRADGSGLTLPRFADAQTGRFVARRREAGEAASFGTGLPAIRQAGIGLGDARGLAGVTNGGVVVAQADALRVAEDTLARRSWKGVLALCVVLASRRHTNAIDTAVVVWVDRTRTPHLAGKTAVRWELAVVLAHRGALLGRCARGAGACASGARRRRATGGSRRARALHRGRGRGADHRPPAGADLGAARRRARGPVGVR